MIAMYAIPLRVVFLLRELGYPSPLVLALGIALPSLFASSASFLAWVLQQRMSALAIVVLTFLSVALGYGIIAVAESPYGVFAGLAFCGIGFGLNTPNLTGWLQQTVPAEMRGRAAGGFATAVFLGQFLATFVFAYLARVTDFAGTFTVIALASVVVALCALVAKMAFGMASIGVITKSDGRAVLENQAARRVE
jgi:MFS family permease